MNLNYTIINQSYYNELKDELLQFINLIGENIIFNDDIWICDKINRHKTTDKIKIYFSQFPNEFKDIIKFYVLMRLRNRSIKLKTAISCSSHLSIFFNYIFTEHNITNLKFITFELFNDYEVYLRKKYTSEATRYTFFNAVKIFFSTMKDWNEIAKEFNIINPFNNTNRKISNKYIPEQTIHELDKILKNEQIELVLRTIYWIMRSFPSRISEIVDMSLTCLKPYDDHLVLFIPMYKQNGGYIDAQIRSLHIEYKGHGKFLIDLIRQQQQLATSLQNKLAPEIAKNMLFLYPVTKLLISKSGKFKYSNEGKYTFKNINSRSVSHKFKRICKIFNLLDKEDNPYSFTTHQLRHNGITERFDFGFSPALIRLTTSHQGETMLDVTYNHTNLNEAKIIEKQRLLQKKRDEINNFPENNKVLFKGRILNLDEQVEKRILKNFRGQKLKYGICTDITSCKSGIYECLKCSNYSPNIEDLDYFKSQVQSFEKKAIIFNDSKFLLENIQYNLELHKNIVIRIENAIISGGLKIGKDT